MSRLCSACKADAERPVRRKAVAKPAGVEAAPSRESRCFNCLRCGYTWSAKRYLDREDDSYQPHKCPACGSTGWNSERKPVEPKPREVAPVVEAKPAAQESARKRPVLTEAREPSTSGFTSTLCSLGLLHGGTPLPARKAIR